ncbi:DUF5655 domain-containing protein [Microlunatus ginsengisoli]|uniref:DUF5655 domain-containing protein n=1 Tax=Microlunatus ginsengisoli TaxID=363863 RepID=A0ABP7AH56_9ACTN
MSPELWHCPHCGRTFANRNQNHTCAPLGDLDRHFEGKDPAVRQSFDAVLAVVDALGPVEVLAEKSRIALHVRMSFAAFTPRRHTLPGHLVLARVVDSPRWDRVQTFSPRNVLHAFMLSGPHEVDAEFAGWLAEAYDVGAQRHLRRPADPDSPGSESWMRE